MSPVAQLHAGAWLLRRVDNITLMAGSPPAVSSGLGGAQGQLSLPPGMTIPGMPGAAPGAVPPEMGSLPGTGMPAGPINPFIYQPSFSTSITASIAFLLLSFVLAKQLIRTKAWYLNLVPQAALITAAGMIARTHAILNPGNNMGAFAASMFATQIPPSLLIFGNFFTFTRIMWWVTPPQYFNSSVLLLPPKQMSLIWGGVYMIGEIAKAIGTNMRTNPIAHKAQDIGIIYQMFCLGLFSGFVWRFMRLARGWEVPYDAMARRWRSLAWTVCAVSVLLTIRNMYLIIEFDGAPDMEAKPPKMGYVALNEWPLWLGNVAPLAISLLLYCITVPGDYIPREYTRLRWKITDIETFKRGSHPQTSALHVVTSSSPSDKMPVTTIEEVSSAGTLR